MAAATATACFIGMDATAKLLSVPELDRHRNV
jgi:hypothetical protein